MIFGLHKRAIPNWWIYRRGIRRRFPAPDHSDRVAIFKPDRLGDFVLAIGAIRRIVDSIGAHRCVLLISKFSREMAAREFPTVEILEVPYLSWRLWETRRGLHELVGHPVFRSGVDRLVCLRHHRFPHEDLICAAIPARLSVGSRHTSLGTPPGELIRRRLEFDHCVASPKVIEGQCEELGWHAAVVASFLGQPIGLDEILPVLGPQRPAATDPWITVSPFGSAQIRDLPEPLLVAAAVESSRRGLGLRLASPAGDEARFNALAGRLREAAPQAISVTVQATPKLEDLISLLKASRLVITAETATAHLATALDCPTITVVGGGHYGIFSPWHRSSQQQWLVNRVPCFGCHWECHLPAPLCITGVSNTQLLNAFSQILGFHP
ncbi:MAG: lipopolysaccharide heptosyltransferase family protein [Pedosphaera sp.]|nr:lipopolysaccharide heptosyltransferase family protein [Pedosphaera sp.]